MGIVHRTFVKKDANGKVLATARVATKGKHYLADGFEEIKDDPNIAEHGKYYAVKE